MRPSLRLLHLEDNPTDAELVQALLEADGLVCEVVRTETRAEFVTALEQGGFDLILSDYSLPGFDGLSALSIARQHDPEVPFIFVSGVLGEEVATETLKSGATDYVLKQRLSRLVSSVQRALREADARTERQQAEEALFVSEERFRLIMEHATDAIFYLALNGDIAWTSLQAAVLTGRPMDHLVGLPMTRLLSPASAAQAKTWLAVGRAKAPPALVEMQVSRPDGRVVWLETSMTTVQKGRDLLGRLLVARDITERKHLQEQLLQAQKMEALGQLAGGVAHDFNNLLTVINGYTELLLSRLSDDDRLQHDLDQIKKAGERAAALTRQLLAFSRRQILQPTVLDLNAVVGHMEKFLRRLIGEDVDLITGLAPELSMVKADQGQIEQILMNLAVNARDAMPGGGKLTIETADVELDEPSPDLYLPLAAGRYVMLTVSDTGSGMDAETKARIFEPFFTTKEPDKGTGLGLSTVYGIVKQSGGSIRVSSELGCGATFTLYLPRIEGGVPEPEPQAAAPIALDGSETIVLVEDEPALRGLMRTMLQQYSYTVLEARHGIEALALEALHSQALHLLITDVILPQMSGPTLAARLRVLHPEIKVLFVSGNSNNAAALHGIIDSINFLQKPFTREALARKVREVLDAPGQGEAYD